MEVNGHKRQFMALTIFLVGAQIFQTPHSLSIIPFSIIWAGVIAIYAISQYIIQHN